MSLFHQLSTPPLRADTATDIRTPKGNHVTFLNLLIDTFSSHNQSCEENYDFLDVVQGRLVKLWFGVSKFASTSSLVNAVEWEKASNLGRTSHETHTALGPVSMSDCTLSCRPNFPTGITRRNIGLWLSDGLHDLFCQSRKCYTPAEGCVCKLCNSPADHKSHIIHCRWAIKDEPFELNVSNINIIVKMLQCMNKT